MNSTDIKNWKGCRMSSTIIEKLSLKGKTALITGTTRGLGQSLAEGLLEAGATVIALDRSDNDHLETFSRTLNAVFERIQVDLSTASMANLEQIFDDIVDRYAGINILVNNAGITRRGELEYFEEEDWAEVLDLNLTVPFMLSRIAARHFMKQKSGKIINMASMLSYQGGLRVPSYAASKHGIVGLTRSFANGLALHGINVNAIAPGFMESEMTRPLQQDAERNKSIIARIPAGRWGQGADLKGTLLFLASPLSDYIHGAVIPVDGGWLSS